MILTKNAIRVCCTKVCAEFAVGNYNWFQTRAKDIFNCQARLTVAFATFENCQY